MLGKIKKIRADLPEYMLNSARLSHYNPPQKVGQTFNCPPRKALAPYVYALYLLSSEHQFLLH